METHGTVAGFAVLLLPLDSPGSAARYQRVYLRLVEAVEVAGNRVLQAGCRHGELQSLAGSFAAAHGINESRREAVSRSYPIHDVRDLILLAEKELLPALEAG